MVSGAITAEQLIAGIGEKFENWPAELKKAARYVTSNPGEVAFRPIRGVASAAGVSTGTMVRLAQALGLERYGQLREVFQAQLQQRPKQLLARVQKMKTIGPGADPVRGMHDLIEEEISIIRDCVENLDGQDMAAIAALFAASRRFYVLGLRGMYPAAFLFHYATALFSEKVVLVEGGGSTAVDAMRGMADKDVLLVFTCQPYPREVLMAVQYARKRRTRVIAVTDGLLSPAARAAQVAVIVRPTGAGLQSSAVANVLVSRVLAALCLAACGKKASAGAIRNADQHFSEFDVYGKG